MNSPAGLSFATAALQPPADTARRVGPRWPAGRLLGAALAVALVGSLIEGYLLRVNGQLSKLPAAILLAGWLAHRLLARRPALTPHPLLAGVGLLAIVVLISAAVNGTNPNAMLMTIRWIPFLVLTAAMINLLTEDVHPRVAQSAIVAGAAIAAGGALFSFAVLDDARATGPLEDPNDLAYVLTAAVPIVLTRLGVARGRAALGYAVLLGLLVVGSAATVSRGGLIALAATVTWVAVRRVVPTRVLIGGGVLAGVIVMATVLVAYPQVERALSEKKYIASTNIETRTLRWQSALRIIASHPLTGVGPGGAAYHYVEYSGFAELAERTPVTHEMYLEVGADLGLVGLGLFLSLIIGSFTATELAVRRLRRAHAPPAHPDLVAALACQGSLIAVCITSSFLSEEYYMPLWAAIAVAAAVELRTRDLGRRREVTLRASTSHHR